MSEEAQSTAHATSEAVDLVALACLLACLTALTALAYHLGLESKAFSYLMAIATAGFAVHYFLPLRRRLGFFIVLSTGAIVYLLGTGPGLWLLGIGVALIGISKLPVGFGVRVGLLLAAGVALIALRGGFVSGPVPAPVWPILGSIFMFRLIVYLYDIRHDASLATWPRALAYFFLLPNVCFPLFPVVDFKTFCRQYYNSERHSIYTVGVQWIFRGMLQLVLYRIVYRYLVTQPASVATIADLGQYLLWPYLLYLRVSGQFHIIVGILHLFGFNLPETHHSYYLASSFTDFWRRINIYWKDFMMKVFYYPAFFALRRRGEALALVLATLLVFLVTWALHSYQTFWIQGFFLLAWHDGLFWALLAVFVVINSLREWRRGRQRRLGDRVLPWRETCRTALATVAMFTTMAILWSLWSSESIGVWMSLWAAALVPPTSAQLWQVALVVSVPALVALWSVASSRAWFAERAAPTLTRQTATIVAVSVTLAVVTSHRVSGQLGEARAFATTLRQTGLNQADLAGLERGYYENLMGVDRFNGELWALYMNRPPDWERGLKDAGLSIEREGWPSYELRPGANARFKAVPLVVNRWGLHDKDYEQTPPAGCHRLAVLGASHTMGSGVLREQTFENLLEARLNRERGGCYEILNFAVYGYSPFYQVGVLSGKVARFQPHGMLYVAHPEDGDRVVRFLASKIRERQEIPYQDLVSLLSEWDIRPDLSEREVVQRLAPHSGELLEWLYRRLVADSRGLGVVPAYVLLPMLVEPEPPVSNEPQLVAARAAGFVVLDLSDVYRGSDRNSLWVAEWDAHPNARGHAVIADRLSALFRQHESELLPSSPGE